MIGLLSTTCQYALRALVHLEHCRDKGPVLARDIAEATQVPRHFLSKILQRLGQHGLVRSQKGPGGGFTLAREAGSIRVLQVMSAVEGQRRTELPCVLGRAECGKDGTCRMHDALADMQQRFDEGIGSLSIADIAPM